MPRKKAATTLAPAADGAAVATVVIPPIDVREAIIPIVGDTPLVVHRWSEKAKRQIEERQTRRARSPREPKDPQYEFEQSLYRLPDGSYGLPAIAFKKAAVAACRYIPGVPMTFARGAFYVVGEPTPEGELVRIHGEPRLRQDMVRVDDGTADIRYRAEFPEWSAELLVRFNAGVISLEQIVQLLQYAGFHVGVGENRPERSGGQNGLFHVVGVGEEV